MRLVRQDGCVAPEHFVRVMTSGVPSHVVIIDVLEVKVVAEVPSHVVITDVMEVKLVAEVPSHVVVTAVQEVKLVVEVPSHVVITAVLEVKLVVEVPSHVVITDVLEVKLVVVLSVENLYQCVELLGLVHWLAHDRVLLLLHVVIEFLLVLPSLLRAQKEEGRSIDADIAAHRCPADQSHHLFAETRFDLCHHNEVLRE